MIDKFYEELSTGERWVSGGRTITETDLVMFSAFSGDWFPIHSNIEYARETPYKKRIAHGMLVLSVSTGLMRFDASKVAVFYGMDRIRFVNPTFIGDTVYVEATVREMADHSEHQGLAILEITVENQHRKDVMIGSMKLMVNKRRK
ncbi:MaoC/PaaZ C-terminal domain-containing protein [Virgibacillus sediminis]|uniref:MaoC/PaaZ C-terminal domain-containing protein n=1 Tax=Virgibacillus sediminis TaxID=202260 RepID=A0ABV7AA13_9BACI